MKLAVLIDGGSVPPEAWPRLQAMAGALGMIAEARVFTGRPTRWTGIAEVTVIDGPEPADASPAAVLRSVEAGVIAGTDKIAGVVVVSGDNRFAMVLHAIKRRGLRAFVFVPASGAFPRRLIEAADLALVLPAAPPAGAPPASDAAPPPPRRTDDP